MYRSIADFTQDWEYERGMTRKLLDNLTDASLNQAVRPGGRTLGRLAWHLAITLAEMPGHAGLPVAGPDIAAPVPPSATAIAAAYTAAAESLARTVPAHWTDASLSEQIPMYGQTWTKGQVLDVLIKHEAHHRGQMTVLMRQAGLPVSGVYGPAEEEWAAMGIPPQQ